MSIDTLTTNDRVSLDIPDFVGTDKGWNGGVSIGNLQLFEFSLVLKQIDPTGALRQAMTDALNASPGLRVAVMHAAFSRAPVTSA